MDAEKVKPGASLAEAKEVVVSVRAARRQARARDTHMDFRHVRRPFGVC